jgi:hypothetical protein
MNTDDVQYLDWQWVEENPQWALGLMLELHRENTKLREAYEFLREHGDIASVVICRADYILSNAQKIVMPRRTSHGTRN